MSKVLLLNGSPHPHGCTATALEEMIRIFEEEGIETELIQVGIKDIRGCISCGQCSSKGKCVFDDLVNEVAEKFEKADGLVIGSPVYYGSPNGTLLSFLDRLFYSSPFSKHMKVGASVVSCRRGGNSASFDVLNKYFTISSMPVASSYLLSCGWFLCCMSLCSSCNDRRTCKYSLKRIRYGFDAIGMDILGWDNYSFHSFLCNSL